MLPVAILYVFHFQAALCEVHVAAVIAEYLRGEGVYNEGCKPFSIISPNILRDETNTRTDHAGEKTRIHLAVVYIQNDGTGSTIQVLLLHQKRLMHIIL